MSNSEQPEEIRHAKELIQILLRAKKNLRIYPPNNPIFSKTIEDAFRKMEEFLSMTDEFKLRIKQNELFFEKASIYQNASKEDNLALFFFKDGLREITFKRGLTIEEMHDFLDVISFDFEREDSEDDVITLLWEKDFKNIKYVVDETVLTEDDNYEEEASKTAREVVPTEDDLKKAYEDATLVEELKEVNLMPITDRDLEALVKEFEKDSYGKREKLMEILFDMFRNAETPAENEDIISILKGAVEFSIKHGDLEGAVDVLRKTTEIMNSSDATDEIKKNIAGIFSAAGSDDVIKTIGELLDSGAVVNESTFNDFVAFLGRNAIQPFMSVLGDLKTINARKTVINALTALGSKDILALAKGLKDDRWYVVRNIIYILRRIGDKRAVEHLTKAVRHSDVRVRKEALKALGELGGQGVLQPIRESLDDPDVTVRSSAVRALSSLGTDYAKRILIERVNDGKFKNAEFAEKKEYYEALARWKDAEVFDFLMKTLKKTTLFGRAKNDENRACAALALGLVGNKEALQSLYKLRDSNNKVLSEYAYSAIRRIEYGQ